MTYCDCRVVNLPKCSTTPVAGTDNKRPLPYDVVRAAHLMREFNVPSSTVQWLTTGFMLTNGIMIPVTAFLIETFTTRQLFLYAMGMVIAFAPALGPTISGLLVEWLSWRWMFALLVAIAGGVIAAACFTVHNVGEPTHPHIDVLSVVLSTSVSAVCSSASPLPAETAGAAWTCWYL